MSQPKPNDIGQVRCINVELVNQANEALSGNDVLAEVWLCSRNDIITNTSVLAAAALVALTHSILLALAVGLLLTLVFAQSAGKV